MRTWTVRLGNSGLKVSRIILGTMQYGHKDWQGWVLEEEEAIKHIKFAYVRLPPHHSTCTDSMYRHFQLRRGHPDVRFCGRTSPIVYAAASRLTFYRTGIFQWAVRSYPRKRHQETEPSARRACHYDEGLPCNMLIVMTMQVLNSPVCFSCTVPSHQNSAYRA